MSNVMGEALDTSQDVNSDNDPNNDKKNEELYNILEITAQKTNFDNCCRISKKTECPTNYESKTVAGQSNCYPNCAQAAEYAGYAQSNSQISPANTTCSAITPMNTWKLVPDFYDPYNFKILTSRNVVTPANQYCCVKNEDPTETEALEDDGGTYDVIAGTPTTTTITTTTTN